MPTSKGSPFGRDRWLFQVLPTNHRRQHNVRLAARDNRQASSIAAEASGAPRAVFRAGHGYALLFRPSPRFSRDARRPSRNYVVTLRLRPLPPRFLPGAGRSRRRLQALFAVRSSLFADPPKYDANWPEFPYFLKEFFFFAEIRPQKNRSPTVP